MVKLVAIDTNSPGIDIGLHIGASHILTIGINRCNQFIGSAFNKIDPARTIHRRLIYNRACAGNIIYSISIIINMNIINSNTIF